MLYQTSWITSSTVGFTAGSDIGLEGEKEVSDAAVHILADDPFVSRATRSAALRVVPTITGAVDPAPPPKSSQTASGQLQSFNRAKPDVRGGALSGQCLVSGQRRAMHDGFFKPGSRCKLKNSSHGAGTARGVKYRAQLEKKSEAVQLCSQGEICAARISECESLAQEG